MEGFVAGGGDRTDKLETFVGGAVLPAELNVSFPMELTVCTVSSLGDVQAGCPVVVLFRIGTLFIQCLGEGLVRRFVEVLGVGVADQGCFETYLHDDFPS